MRCGSPGFESVRIVNGKRVTVTEKTARHPAYSEHGKISCEGHGCGAERSTQQKEPSHNLTYSSLHATRGSMTPIKYSVIPYIILYHIILYHFLSILQRFSEVRKPDGTVETTRSESSGDAGNSNPAGSQGLGFNALGFRVKGLGFKGLGFRVQGFRV